MALDRVCKRYVEICILQQILNIFLGNLAVEL